MSSRSVRAVKAGPVKNEVGSLRARVRLAAFRRGRVLLHRVLLPLLVRSDALNAAALRLSSVMFGALEPRTDGLPCPIHADGLEFWYDETWGSTAIRGLAAGVYERPVAELIGATLRPGMKVIDVGAHIGYYSMLAARCVGPDGQVFSFEPDPANRKYLVRNLEANGVADWVQVVPAAVSERAGEVLLYRMEGDTGIATLYPQKAVFGDPVPVASTSLDAWAESAGWPAIDLIKIDAEGAEGAISVGMAELVRRNPRIVIVMELHAEAMEASGTPVADLLSRLRTFGLKDLGLLDVWGYHALDVRPNCAAILRRSKWVAPTLVAGSRDLIAV
jgi:FkbM family methyltransferase